MADFNAEEDDSTLESEVEALRSIYIHELEVDYNGRRPACVIVHLHPATADNLQKQYVRLSLILKISDGYPNALPKIVIRNPRGLSDEEIERITHDLYLKAEEKNGSPMLFELIEVAKEHLTLGNTPSCQCAICLYGFTESDVFTKTECYHYFHSHCLARYVKYILQKNEEEKQTSLKWIDKNSTFEVVCPVCRLPISYSDLIKGDFPPPCEEEAEESFSLSSEMKQLQHQMAHLYKKQKSQGGIIDLDVEKKRYLLEISNTSGDADKNVTDPAETFNAKHIGISNYELNRCSSTRMQINSHLSSTSISGKFDISSNGTQAASPVLKVKSHIRNYGKHYSISNRGRRGSTSHHGKDDCNRKERDKRLGRLNEGFISEHKDKDEIIIKSATAGQEEHCLEASWNVERDSYASQECQGHNVHEIVEVSHKRTDMHTAQNHPSSSRVQSGAFSSSSNPEHKFSHSFHGNRYSEHHREGAHKNHGGRSNHRSYYNSRKPRQNRGGRPFYDTYHRESHTYRSNSISPAKEDNKDVSYETESFSIDDKEHENSEIVPISSQEYYTYNIPVNEHRKNQIENSSVACHVPRKMVGPPPGFGKVVYGPPVIKPPPGFGQR